MSTTQIFRNEYIIALVLVMLKSHIVNTTNTKNILQW